jgi:predicted phosphodiesterase
MRNSGLPISESDMTRAIALYEQHGSYEKAAAAGGLSIASLRRHLKKAAQSGMTGTAPVMHGYEIAKTSHLYDENGEIIRTTVYQREERGDDFEIPKGHAIKGVSALIDADGRTIQQWVKTKQGELSPEGLTEVIADAIKAAGIPLSPSIATPAKTDKALLTVYPIADVHLSLRATEAVSGTNYNLDIASADFRLYTRRLVDSAPASEAALISILGDITHHDDDKNMTPRSGHILEVSNSMFQTVRQSITLFVEFIYHALSKHKKVRVKVVKGNHDISIWMALVFALREHFKADKRVTVDLDEADYWFFRWGVTLIGAHHGHRLKPEQMAAAMAMECREDWGETLYRWFMHGHLHHRRQIETMGVLVECMRTLAAVDQHHSGKYGSQKSLIAVSFHKDDGEIARSQVSIAPSFKRAAA